MSCRGRRGVFFFFFFNDTATTEIYTLSLHDALPISGWRRGTCRPPVRGRHASSLRSEEHTSELQSPCNLVCRLLLEKKKKQVWQLVYFFLPTFQHTHWPAHRSS